MISTIRDAFLESKSFSSNATCEFDTNSTNSSTTTRSNRKRRRGAASNLTRINLNSAKLSVSNESLNSNASLGVPTTAATLSDDDSGEDSASTTVFEFDKRLRLCSQSSTISNITNTNTTSTTTDDCFNLIELECANGGGNGSSTVLTKRDFV